MGDRVGETDNSGLRLDFNRRLRPRSRPAAQTVVATQRLLVLPPRPLRTLQMAEVAVSRQMFADILTLIIRLRVAPVPA
jgi:hypothetical protein